jgi:hypothetical protein
MADIITRTIDIGDGPIEVISGRTYDVQAVAFAATEYEDPLITDRIDIDVNGRLDLTKPGTRLFFITSDGFVELPASTIREIREVR